MGEPPGTLVYTGEKPIVKTKIKIIDYNKEDYHIQEDIKIDEKLAEIKKGVIRWIDITGLADIKIIEEIGNHLDIHPLILEDILNTNQRPKFEDYEKYIFLVLKRLLWNESNEIFDSEQISILLGSNYVISFLEQESDIFNPILERIKNFKGRIRMMGADYLAYSLMDVIIDNYFLILETIGDIIEALEEDLVKNPEPAVLQSIYRLKRNSIELRKSIWPLRQVINSLQREQSDLISDELQIYLRDIYDHIFRVSELLDNYRDIIFGMIDIYLSSISNKMNDIMKVLTIISTTFIPISFLAGFYGMNFIYMPELSNRAAYPILIIVMISIFTLMLLFFRRKKWI
ncbi:MAG: magnesium/cobalt transporter CorA [Promethearchaeota archaeon]